MAPGERDVQEAPELFEGIGAVVDANVHPPITIGAFRFVGRVVGFHYPDGAGGLHGWQGQADLVGA